MSNNAYKKTPKKIKNLSDLMSQGKAKGGDKMSTSKKSVKRLPVTGKYQPLTVGDLEKKSGTKFKVPSNTRATTYLNTSGVPSLGRVLQKIEQKLAHNN